MKIRVRDHVKVVVAPAGVAPPPAHLKRPGS
jgi:hypothetical protein